MPGKELIDGWKIGRSKAWSLSRAQSRLEVWGTSDGTLEQVRVMTKSGEQC